MRTTVPDKAYTIICDESDRKGRYYGNFYGGVIVGSKAYHKVIDALESKKSALGLLHELKWQRVSESLVERYCDFIHTVFDQVRAGHIRFRIMFRQKANVPPPPVAGDFEAEYFKLYYQFIKHGFGIGYMPASPAICRLALLFDQFPDTRESAARFKGYLAALEKSPSFRSKNISLKRQDITEIRSHEHILSQAVDIILGSMSFRLNDKHLEKPKGSYRRGKRTIAKEKIYKFIRSEICTMRPNFNVGISSKASLSERWSAPYLHWNFIPNDAKFDPAHAKK